MMGKIGFFELVIILMIFIGFLGVIVLSITKLIKSKISPNQKIIWIFVMLLFHVLGIIAFLIYHDYYLTPEQRAIL
jgi:hypothetical protein